MPKRDRVKISEKVLKRLEEKIRKQILHDIGDVVTAKCKEFLEKHCAKSSNNNNWPDLTKSDDWKGEVPVVTQEIEFLKNSLALLQKDCNKLSDKTDHILGSVTFIADEYDDLYRKVSEISQLSNNISNLQLSVNAINNRQVETELQLDQLEQYGRRENLEIHGIPVTKNENTRRIVKDLAISLNVKLDDTHISTCHRMPPLQTPKSTKRKSHTGTSRSGNISSAQHPAIIVRFSNRDKRNELYGKRKLLNKIKCGKINSSLDSTQIRENLTAYRKMLLNEAVKAKKLLNFKFIWTSQGRIRLRKDSESRIINVNSLSDLSKIGYSDPDVGQKMH